MKRIITITIFISFLLPLIASGQIGTPTTTESISISSDLIQQVRNLDGPEISHGQVVIDQGIRKRFNESKSDVADLPLNPGTVLNNRLLELYVRKLALSEPIKQMNIGEESVQITLDGPAQLLGIIPITVPYEVAVDFDSGITDVSVTTPAWWSILATKKSTSDIASGIEEQVSTAEYLSRIQLRAFILEAILFQVTD